MKRFFKYYFFGFIILWIPKKWIYDTLYFNTNSIIISFGQCGCPCPDKVISGEIIIPNSTKDTTNFLDNYVYTYGYLDLDYSNLTSEVKVYGEYDGVELEACNPVDCIYVPKFKYKAIAYASYFPLFLDLSMVTSFSLSILQFIYLIFGINKGVNYVIRKN